jgi:predicted dehydrogenase
MKVAVVGAGYWGPNLVRVFTQNPDVTGVTVCDIDKKRLDRMKKSHPGIGLSDNLDALLSDGAVDAVVVALPAALHYDAAKKALRAGKHVLVEKPLAATGAEAEELCRLAEDGKRVLMVGHTFLFNAAVKRVKDYIDSGTLGEVYYVYGQRLNLGIVRQDVDALWNLAPHDISILLHWLGDKTPAEVAYQGASYLQKGVDDVGFLAMRFAGGVVGHIHVSWLDPGKVRRMTVVGSAKMVVYDDVSADARVQLFDKGIDRKKIDTSLGSFNDYAEFQLLQRAGDLLIPRVDFPEPLKEEAAHFVACCREGKTPIADGANGLRVVRVLEAARRSRDTGGATVKL